MARIQKRLTDSAVYRITYANGDVVLKTGRGVDQSIASRKNGRGGEPIVKVEAIYAPDWQDVTEWVGA